MIPVPLSKELGIRAKPVAKQPSSAKLTPGERAVRVLPPTSQQPQ